MKRRKTETEPLPYDDYEPDGSRASLDDSDDSGASFERTPRSPAAYEGDSAETDLRHERRILDRMEPLSFKSLKEREAEDAMAVKDSHRKRPDMEEILGSKHFNIRRSFSAPPQNNLRHDSPPDGLTRHLTRPNRSRMRSFGPAGSARTGVARRSSSYARSLDEEAQPLTYEEELIFIESENILKHTRSSTDLCKDVSVTLQFFLNSQAHLDTRARDTLEQIKMLNDLLKDVLLLIEPLQDEKKTAIFVLNELAILMRSAQIPLSMLEKDFALFDITPLSLESRRQEWKKLMLAFQEENPFSLPEHLELSCRYGSELLANVRAGILSTSESDLLKSRICQINGFAQDSALRHLLDPRESRPSSAAPHSWRDVASRNLSPELVAMTVPKRQQSSNRSHTRFSDDTDVEDASDNEDRSSTASTLAESKSVPTGEVNWLWICQTDITPGYWATPWKHLFPDAVCLGAISVLLKALEKFTTKTNFKYVESQPYYTEWHCRGKITYPSYAHNSKGGIVVSGTYEPVKFSAFERRIVAIELLHSYDHQVDRSPLSTTESAIENNGELMGLDSWLSMAGRLAEIVLGPSDLLRTLPTLIQRVMTDFELEFSSLDRTSKEGGLQIIETIAEGLLQTFKEQDLSEAEQLFASLALLRAAKVGLCIARGPDTRKLADVLRHDVQVYLA